VKHWAIRLWELLQQSTESNTRVNPFPFLFGNSHWLFLVDISSSMAGENKISKIKNAFTELLNNYIKYGEKISIYLYNYTVYKITKTFKNVCRCL
jgi:hypothetical protein